MLRDLERLAAHAACDVGVALLKWSSSKALAIRLDDFSAMEIVEALRDFALAAKEGRGEFTRRWIRMPDLPKDRPWTRGDVRQFLQRTVEGFAQRARGDA